MHNGPRVQYILFYIFMLYCWKFEAFLAFYFFSGNKTTTKNYTAYLYFSYVFVLKSGNYDRLHVTATLPPVKVPAAH